MENQTHLSADAQHMVETFGNAESDPTGRSDVISKARAHKRNFGG